MQALVERRRETLAPGKHQRRRTHAAVLVAVLLCALTAFVECFVLKGVIFPIAVASRSMAPALMGPVRVWTCTTCRQEFVCSLDALVEPPREVHCPKCGAAAEVDAGRDRPGRRVFVDRATAYFRPLARWEAIVYRDHEDPDQLCVKRVVGLPGESVQVLDGEVFVDGRVAQKTLAQFRRLAVRVHGPTIDGQTWDIGQSHGWQVEPGHARFAGLQTENALPLEWLTYKHRNNAGESVANSIVDESPYDQAESRVLNPVHDLLFACRARVRGAGQLCLRVRSERGEFVATLAPELGTGRLTREGITLGYYTFPAAPFASGTLVELAIVDYGAILAVSGDTVFTADFETDAGSNDVSPPELAVGARDADLDIYELSVLRDVFYTPAPSGRPAKARLGADEYYVLGDNSPHALDSRNGLGPVKKGQILGIARWW
jgi:signal peptidase I